MVKLLTDPLARRATCTTATCEPTSRALFFTIAALRFNLRNKASKYNSRLKGSTLAARNRFAISAISSFFSSCFPSVLAVASARRASSVPDVGLGCVLSSFRKLFISSFSALVQVFSVSATGGGVCNRAGGRRTFAARGMGAACCGMAGGGATGSGSANLTLS